MFSAHLSVPEEDVEGLRKWPRLLSSNLSKNNLNSVINRITSIIKIVIMAQHMKAKDDPQILSGIREFLKTLNNSADKPLETLTPEQARQVLIDAQKSVEVDY